MLDYDLTKGFVIFNPAVWGLSLGQGGQNILKTCMRGVEKFLHCLITTGFFTFDFFWGVGLKFVNYICFLKRSGPIQPNLLRGKFTDDKFHNIFYVK